MSNFQEARNLEGQKNDKGYQQGVSMQGTIMALVDPQRIFTTNGKPTQRIQLRDAVGETCKVKVFLGNGPDILQTDVNTLQTFSDLAMNRFKGSITYMAFWDNMHPPQGQPVQLTPEKQAIIDNQFKQPTPQQAAGAIKDRMAGQQPPQVDYAAKEREKVLGMCFTNILSGRLAAVPASELEKDLGEIAAMWRLAAMCIDGTGRVGDTPTF